MATRACLAQSLEASPLLPVFSHDALVQLRKPRHTLRPTPNCIVLTALRHLRHESAPGPSAPRILSLWATSLLAFHPFSFLAPATLLSLVPLLLLLATAQNRRQIKVREEGLQSPMAGQNKSGRQLLQRDAYSVVSSTPFATQSMPALDPADLQRSKSAAPIIAARKSFDPSFSGVSKCRRTRFANSPRRQ